MVWPRITVGSSAGSSPCSASARRDRRRDDKSHTSHDLWSHRQVPRSGALRFSGIGADSNCTSRSFPCATARALQGSANTSAYHGRHDRRSRNDVAPERQRRQQRTQPDQPRQPSIIELPNRFPAGQEAAVEETSEIGAWAAERARSSGRTPQPDFTSDTRPKSCCHPCIS